MIGNQVGELLADAIAQLEAAGAHDEALGVWKRSRGFLGLRASNALVPAGRAWRLGALLLDQGGGLYATGEVTRAVEPGRGAVNRSQAGEQRRAIRAAAARAFPPGDVVNHGFAPIALDEESLLAGSGPLSVRDGVVVVRFDAMSGDLGIAPLGSYLADRISALLGD